MDFARVETAEISDAELDNVAGGVGATAGADVNANPDVHVNPDVHANPSISGAVRA